MVHSTEVLDANAELFGSISPFWFRATGDGRVIAAPAWNGGTANRLTELVTLAKRKGVPAIGTVVDDIGARGMAALLSDPAGRARHVQALVDAANTYNLDGIDLDYERMLTESNSAGKDIALQVREGFNLFLKDLAASLHASGNKTLVVTVMAKTVDGTSNASVASDHATIGKYSDLVRVMAYDNHWSGGPAGAVAPMDWTRRVLDYETSRIDPAKIELGVPLYGYDWGTPGTKATGVTYAGAMSRMRDYGAKRQWSEVDKAPYFTYVKDGVQRTVWYNDAESVKAKLPLIIEYKIRGVAFWSLEGEDPAVWDVTRAYAYGLVGRTPPPTREQKNFPAALYLDLLGRPGDDDGIEYWGGQLAGGKITRKQIAMQMLRSEEATQRRVTRAYNDVFGRDPDPGGLAYWTKLMRTGLPTAKFVPLQYASAEAFALAGGTNEAWVRSLYTRLLGREADPDGLAYWVKQVAAKGRGPVANAFYLNLESRQGQAAVLYQLILDRPADAGGRDYYAGLILKMNEEEVAALLASSDEYYARAQTRAPDWAGLG